jgi:hypothetical protein
LGAFERHGEALGVAGQLRPLLALEAVFRGRLEDLGDALPGNRRPPAQPAHQLTRLARLLGQTDELRMARGDRR